MEAMKEQVMAQYGWSICPVPVCSQIQNFCQQGRIILGNNLVGIYLHGSLAMGCFNPERSDIDLLVVTQQQMSVEMKYRILVQLLSLSNAPCPIEISFLILPELHPFEHPLLYDLHYSETWRQQKKIEMKDGTWQHWNEEKRRDPDLAAHLMITNNRGITLYGKTIREVLPLVPNQDYINSILGDYRDAREGQRSNPVYFVLNACRICAYLSEGHVYSKDEGGVYGLKAFPVEYHVLIRQSLELYRGQSQSLLFDEKMLDRFTAFIDQRISSHQREVT